MTLDELLTEMGLLREGFIGPITLSELGKKLGRLLPEKGINIQILPIYISGEDDKKLYRIYYHFSESSN